MSESTEIAHRQEGGALAKRGSDSANILAMIIEAARDPTIDAGKVKTMADLAMQLQDREKQEQFNRDFVAAIMEMPIITKDGRIIIKDKQTGVVRLQGRFAKYEDIDRVVKPIARRHNIAYRFQPGSDPKDGSPTVRCIVMHTNGVTDPGEAMRLPLDTSGGKNNVQGAGSSITYGKRYALCAAFDIVTEGLDDDGNMGVAELPFERGNTVLSEAETAHAAGTYTAFFASQSPKDRAWLVSHGHHARFGGTLTLPGADPRTVKEPELAGPNGAPKAKPVSHTRDPEAPDVSTPDGWTKQYEIDCAAAASLDDLARVQSKGKKGMDRLKDTHAALHQRAVTAGSEAYARLSGTSGEAE